MIIAGFSGVGKTTFAKTHQNVIDLHIMPYKYTNLNEVNNNYNDESIKAAPELILNPDWRYDYYDKLISLYKSEPNKIIVIPTDIQIMNWLAYEEITFTLVFPSYDLKEEYRNKYLERGNTEAFIDIFINDWDYWIGMFKLQKGCKKIELKTNEYLSDVISFKGDRCDA
ncbi:MAG: hypothetical protein HFH11_03130 [Dorea sp.]|nr:hypothetical protein [Dorea sp.]MCI9270141.1 hypothetical protein [Dorea sp.]